MTSSSTAVKTRADTDVSKDDQPSYAYAWYVMGVLVLAYVFSFIDRQILALMVGPIRRDLGISDTGFSLLSGLAFGLFYTLMGIPLGRMADNHSRRKLITAGIFLWSAMTVVCGFTKTFWQLFIARMGVGVGEAALSPAAQSMISDYFPREKLGLALGIYQTGIFIGAGLAFIIGGLIVETLASAGPVSLPLVGPVRAWQLVFFIVGLPGILVAALVFYTVKEPKRRGIVAQEAIPLKQALAFVMLHKRTFGLHFAGMSLMVFHAYGLFAWLPEFFHRTYGWEPGRAGVALGLGILVFSTTGVIVGGVVADYLHKKGKTDAFMRSAAIGAIALTPCAVLAPLMPTPVLSFILLVPTLFFMGFPNGPAVAVLQVVAPNRLRGQIVALYLFVINIVGLSLGATAIALFTDYVFRDEGLIGYSMASTALLVLPVASICLWTGLKPFRASLALVAETADAVKS